MRYKLAIDFGTTNSLIAVYDEHNRRGQSIAIPGISIRHDAQSHLILSLVWVADGNCGQVKIGAEVTTARLDRLDSNRLFCNFKRAIGAQRGEVRQIDGAP